MQSGTNVSVDQYRFWGRNLAEYVSLCHGTSLAAATVDTNILSERNFMVVAFRHVPTDTFPRPVVNHQLADVADRCVERASW